jgi:uncharacterized membrane protein YkvA (DUF1232 family)
MRQRLALAWRLLRDGRVAPRLKLLAPAIALLYVFLPIDLVPDFLLGLGQVDDLGVVAIAVIVLTRLLPHLAPDDVLQEHLRGMGGNVDARPGSTKRDGEDVVDATFTVRH